MRLKLDIAMYLVANGIALNTFDNGGITPAWSVQHDIDRQVSGPIKDKLIALRAAMQARGVKFPPDPPEVVRDHMRAQGLKVVVPRGQSK